MQNDRVDGSPLRDWCEWGLAEIEVPNCLRGASLCTDTVSFCRSDGWTVLDERPISAEEALAGALLERLLRAHAIRWANLVAVRFATCRTGSVARCAYL